MDIIQKQSAYLGQQIVEINTNPDPEFETSFSKLRIRDIIEIGKALPDKYLDLTFGEFQDLTIYPEKGEAFVEELIESMTEEQMSSLEALFKRFLLTE